MIKNSFLKKKELHDNRFKWWSKFHYINNGTMRFKMHRKKRKRKLIRMNVLIDLKFRKINYVYRWDFNVK
jgi:hypothetical protein